MNWAYRLNGLDDGGEKGMMAGAAGSSHLSPQARGREQCTLGMASPLKPQSLAPARHTFSNKTTPHNPSQTVLSTGGQVFKHMCLKGPFLTKSSTLSPEQNKNKWNSQSLLAWKCGSVVGCLSSTMQGPKKHYMHKNHLLHYSGLGAWFSIFILVMCCFITFHCKHRRALSN